jgi:ankyrin repeat protein
LHSITCNQALAEMLLAHTPDAVAASNAGGASPLHLAAHKGKPNTCNLLVDHGASVQTDVKAHGCELCDIDTSKAFK